MNRILVSVDIVKYLTITDVHNLAAVNVSNRDHIVCENEVRYWFAEYHMIPHSMSWLQMLGYLKLRFGYQLLIAVQLDDISILTHLFTVTSDFHHAMQYAIRTDNLQVVEMIIDRCLLIHENLNEDDEDDSGEDSNDEQYQYCPFNWDPYGYYEKWLTYAIGHDCVFQLILSHSTLSDYVPFSEQIITECVQRGSVFAITLLIQSGYIDPLTCNKLALVASSGGHYKIVQLLVEHGVDDLTPIIINAIESNHNQAVHKLLTYPQYVDYDLVMINCIHNLEIMHLMVSLGIDNVNPSLMKLCECSNIDVTVCEFLLTHGATNHFECISETNVLVNQPIVGEMILKYATIDGRYVQHAISVLVSIKYSLFDIDNQVIQLISKYLPLTDIDLLVRKAIKYDYDSFKYLIQTYDVKKYHNDYMRTAMANRDCGAIALLITTGV